MTSLINTEGVFMVGNGSVAMSGEGADIIQIFAPCYSLPSVLTLRLKQPDIAAINHRIRGSAAYVTYLKNMQTGTVLGEMIDYTHPHLPIFIRRLSLHVPVTFDMDSSFLKAETSMLSEHKALSFLFEIPEGTPVFSKAKTDKETYCQLLLSPHCTVVDKNITFPAGTSDLLFVGGDYGPQGRESFASCMALSKQALSLDLPTVLEAFHTHWRNIFERITVDRKALSNLPDAEELTEAVAVALLTQTSKEGGVLAGTFYHLAYGRDMYGVFRGYMALGLYDVARRMVSYMASVYREKGFMPNASGMGMSCSHRHENDDVEQTGYYLLELLDYVEATQDLAFFQKHWDYACFLMKAQEAQLAGGMIPFNGDETYIAGGIFPRSGIDHGSMEATALYIGSVSRCLDMAATCGLLKEDEISTHRALLLDAQEKFAENFLDGDKVYINQPNRVERANLPMYRHGVCHHCLHMTHLIRTPEGGYLCAGCYGKTSAPVDRQRYSTDCALWMSVFTGNRLLPENVVRSALVQTIERLRSENFGKEDSQNTVGYELGVVLYAIAEYMYPEELTAYDDILRELLQDRVKGMVWTEYYQNGQPSAASCPYRPWESGMNLTSILKYLQALYHKGDRP